MPGMLWDGNVSLQDEAPAGRTQEHCHRCSCCSDPFGYLGKTGKKCPGGIWSSRFLRFPELNPISFPEKSVFGGGKVGFGSSGEAGFSSVFRWVNDSRSGIFPAEKLGFEGGGVFKLLIPGGFL